MDKIKLSKMRDDKSIIIGVCKSVTNKTAQNKSIQIQS